VGHSPAGLLSEGFRCWSCFISRTAGDKVPALSRITLIWIKPAILRVV